MGCDIHSWVEVKREGKWEKVEDVAFPNPYYSMIEEQGREVPSYIEPFLTEPFYCRNYGLFGFLANVRNYSGIPPLSSPRGFPSDSPFTGDADDYSYDGHSPSYFLLKELLDFDYDQQVEDRRVTRQTGPNSFDGGCTADPGGGEMTTYREIVGDAYLSSLRIMEGLGDPQTVRVVFYFDN